MNRNKTCKFRIIVEAKIPKSTIPSVSIYIKKQNNGCAILNDPYADRVETQLSYLGKPPCPVTTCNRNLAAFRNY